MLLKLQGYMPELPEVETIKRGLEIAIVGKKIVDIDVRKKKMFVGKIEDVVGRKVLGVTRRAKMIIIDLEGEKSLLIHLKMTGQLVWTENKSGAKTVPLRNMKTVVFGHPIPFAGGSELPGNSTHIIFYFDAGILFFNDVRQFGWIKIVNSKEEMAEIIGKLGPEPFDKKFTVEYLKGVLGKSGKSVKLVITDQGKIAGVGNIYANDALFEAGIMPTKPAKQLSDQEIEQLRMGIIRVLEDGIKYGGSSAGDEAYVNIEGMGGKYQDYARVYQRDGEKCKRCGEVIKRIEIGGRGTFYCSGCQE